MLSLLSYDFMQRAFLAVIAMSLFSPVLGTFLILRRQSLMSDTLSHVSLSGVAFGLVLGISPTISTIVIVLIAAVFLEYLRTVYKNFMETYCLQEFYGNRDCHPHVNRACSLPYRDE